VKKGLLLMAPAALMTDLEPLGVTGLTMVRKLQVPPKGLRSVRLAQQLYSDLAGHGWFHDFV